MATWQVLRQIRHMAALATVPPSGNAIFHGESCHIGKVAPDMLEQMVLPGLIVSKTGHETPYDDSPILRRTTIGVLVVVDEGFDPYGEAGMVGVIRADTSESPGAGAIRIADWLNRDGGAFRSSGAEDGLAIASFADDGEVIELGEFDGKRLFAYEMSLRVWHANDESSFPRLLAFAVADATAGDASLTWTDSPTRFDSAGTVIRRASGGTPPTSATAGTGVTGSPFARGTNSVTDSTGTGEFSWAAFAAYDPDTEVKPGTYPAGSDAIDFGTSRTATVTIS